MKGNIQDEVNLKMSESDVLSRSGDLHSNGIHLKQEFQGHTHRSNLDSTKSQPTNYIDEKEHTKSNMQEDESAPPLPPDGGWGWVVLASSFACNVIVDGVCFSFGIFYLAFLDYFQESKSKTAWVGSVLNGTYLSMGPIASALSNRFGCRKVGIAGAIICCFSFFISTFSPNVTVLIITYGGLGGFGFGLLYLPAIVMVGFYFSRLRATATGIAVCGSGIGGFIFAPLGQALLDAYGWRGATWLIAAITLNGAVAAALFRPLKPNSSPPRTENQNNKSEIKDEAFRHETGIGDDVKSLGSICDGVRPPKLVKRALLAVTKNEQLLMSRSCDQLPRDMTRCMSQELGTKARNGSQQSIPCSPLLQPDLFYAGSLVSLNSRQADRQEFGSRVSRRSAGGGCGTSSGLLDGVDGMQDAGQKSQISVRKLKSVGMCRKMTDVISNMLDFSLLFHPVFAIYGLSCFLCMTGFYVPFTYLPDHALMVGVGRGKAAFLLSIIGISNTVARVLCGLVSDRPWANCLLINNVALIIGGTATIMCPLYFNYALLAVYSIIFGAAIAAFVSLRSIIMVELMGLEKLTNAFGLVTMCQGISAFIGAPIAGWLFDITGDYAWSFYMAGGTLAMAGVICLPLRRIATFWTNREERLRQVKNTSI